MNRPENFDFALSYWRHAKQNDAIAYVERLEATLAAILLLVDPPTESKRKGRFEVRDDSFSLADIERELDN